MKPLNYAILKYMTTVKEACPENVIDALSSQYSTFRAFNKADVLTALLTAEANGLLEEWLKNGELSPEEATSMMNDTAYVRRITENLLTAARLLGEAALPPHAA